MKHGISPTRDPSMFNNKGMKVAALILTHEVSKRTGKLMPFRINKSRLNKSERRVEKRQRHDQMYRDFLAELEKRTAQPFVLADMRKSRDRLMERWSREDRA